MKTKTAYRPKNIPTEEPSNIPEEPPQPSESVHIEFTKGADPVEPVAAAVEPATDTDEATAALLRQLQHLRASEQAQREFATQVAAERAAQAASAPTLPAEPEARIALWRQQGLSDENADFMAANIELAVDPRLTRIASDEAAQHYERDTDAHRAATLEAFHRLQGQQAPPEPEVADPAGFFRPRPAPSQEPPGPASYVSAPVSRTAPSGYREPSPRSVRLSPIEQEIARNLGLSDTAYAAGKIRLQKAKANGELQ